MRKPPKQNIRVRAHLTPNGYGNSVFGFVFLLLSTITTNSRLALANLLRDVRQARCRANSESSRYQVPRRAKPEKTEKHDLASRCTLCASMRRAKVLWRTAMRSRGWRQGTEIVPPCCITNVGPRRKGPKGVKRPRAGQAAHGRTIGLQWGGGCIYVLGFCAGSLATL